MTSLEIIYRIEMITVCTVDFQCSDHNSVGLLGQYVDFFKQSS